MQRNHNLTLRRGVWYVRRRVGGRDVWLDEETWDYSTTTGRYRNQFLGEDKKATEKKIKVRRV